jgi:hypothetical protein
MQPTCSRRHNNSHPALKRTQRGQTFRYARTSRIEIQQQRCFLRGDDAKQARQFVAFFLPQRARGNFVFNQGDMHCNPSHTPASEGEIARSFTHRRKTGFCFYRVKRVEVLHEIGSVIQEIFLVFFAIKNLL